MRIFKVHSEQCAAGNVGKHFVSILSFMWHSKAVEIELFEQEFFSGLFFEFFFRDRKEKMSS